MTTTQSKTVSVPMSERRPLRITVADWPVIAAAHEYDNEHEFQAFRHWRIKVRQHLDGRTLVYGTHTTAHQSERGAEGGFLLSAEEAKGDELIRAIRRVAGILDRPEMAQSVISDLPEEEI